MDWQTIHFGISNAGRLWRIALTVLGLILVTFGVLILLLPWLLQFLVGGVFILIGMALLGAALRRRVTARRPPEPFGRGDVIDERR